MASPPQSLLPDSPQAMSFVSVSSPASSSEQSTATSSSKKSNDRGKRKEKKYKELSPIFTTDESMRLPSGKYQCPWAENGLACLHEEDIPTELNKHLRWHQNPVLCPWRDNTQAPCLVRKQWSRDMDRHVENQHTLRKKTDSKYKCNLCKQGFARSDHLKRHVDRAICSKKRQH
ncbi:hypothetical protein PG995_004831 [Apiospora arundinis]